MAWGWGSDGGGGSHGHDPFGHHHHHGNGPGDGRGNKWSLILFIAVGFGGAILEALVSMPAVFWYLLAAFGLALLVYRIKDKKRYRRYVKYEAIIGGNFFLPIEKIAQDIQLDASRVKKDLTRMIDKGYFTDTSFIEATGEYFLRDSRSYNLLQIHLEKEAKKKPDLPEHLVEFGKMLRELSKIQSSIQDAEVWAEVEKIEQITEQIFDSVAKNPDKMPQIRRFLNYYLPTTLKLVGQYSVLDRKEVQSENILQAKAEIRGMMGRLTRGFSSKLDRLYHADFLDISSDVQVLEQMLERDGLLGEEKRGD